MKNDQDMDDPGNMSSTSTQTNAGRQTHRPPSPVPSCVSIKTDRSRDDPPNFSSELGPSGLKSKKNMEGGGALCEDTSVTHPVKSDDPDNKDTLDVPHTSERGDADSAVWSEDSMPRHINFSGTKPHSLKPQLEVNKRCEGSCGICLGNVHHAVKHCKTCSVSYCETHVADHYKSPAFSSHELVNYKQTSRETPAKEQSPKRTSSGISWMLLIILSVLTTHTLHHCYEDPVVIPELRVMMLGETGSGKSASGNTILGREAFKSEASALPVTKSCDSQSGVVKGRKITVIDTPAITTRTAAWLSEKVDPGPHVFLLVIPLGRYTEEDGKQVKWIQGTFGEEALKFTIVLFTGGDQMDQKNIEQFLKESSGLQTLVSSTGGGYHIFDNKTPRGHGQVKGLLEKIELLLRKNMGYSYSYGLHEQVETAVREEEEMKRQEQGQNMEKKIEREIRGQMELKMMTRIAKADATLNELSVVVMATTEQGGDSLPEQVTTAVREEEEMKRREEEDKIIGKGE